MSRSLDDLSPLVRPPVDKAQAAWAAAGLDVLITCTLRTDEQQTALWAQGRTLPGHIVTNAKAGESAHNYGLAIDVVPIMNGKPVWDAKDPIWQVVGEIGEQAGLEWAGAPDFPFHELAHFQLHNWRDHIPLTENV